MSHKPRVVCAMAVVLRELMKRKKEDKKIEERKKKRRMWVKEFREDRYLTYADDADIDIPHTFMQALGIDDAAFNSLLEKIAGKIHKADTVMRLAIPAKLKLQVFLQYVASGCTMTSLDAMFHVSSSSMSKFIPEVADAICQALHEYVQAPTDKNGWNSIADGFQQKYGAKNCVGVLQGKTITNKQWIRYSKDAAIFFWFIADTVHNLVAIDVGTCLRDGLEFSQSNLAKSLENKSIQVPDECYFIGPNSVQLDKHMMTPFIGLGVECLLSKSEEIYNAKVEEALKTADTTFSLLRSRFTIFDNPVTLAPDSVVKLIRACCALHNWMQKVIRTDKEVDVVLPGDKEQDAEAPGISSAPSAYLSNAPGIFNLLSSFEDNFNEEAVSRRYELAERFCNERLETANILMVL